MAGGRRLDGKVALITGSAHGLGRVAAELFAAEGARVVVADLVDGSAPVEAIDSTGGEATFVALDVGDDDSVRAGIQHAIDTFGGLDVLYNNAGISPALLAPIGSQVVHGSEGPGDPGGAGRHRA